LTGNSDYSPHDPDYNAPCLDTRAACARANMRISTLKKHLAQGTGPRGYRLPGSSRWRFSRSDIDAWVKGYEHKPTEHDIERLAKLQAGAERLMLKKRAQRRAETNEEVTA
jgi:hypothetical protein